MTSCLVVALDLVDARDVEGRRAALCPRWSAAASLRHDAEIGELRRSRAPRSRTRCGSASRATRWPPCRGGNSAGSCGSGSEWCDGGGRGSPRCAARRSWGRCRAKTALPATSTLAPALRRPARRSRRLMPPSTSRSIVRPPISALAWRELGQRVGDEALAAEAGIDAHHQHQVDDVDDVLERRHRGRRIDRDAGLLALGADRLQRAVEMRAGLGVDGDDVGAGLGEGRDVGIGRRDHQMAVEELLGQRPQPTARSAGRSVMLGTKWPSITSTWM